MRGISCVAEDILASQEGLCSVELLSLYVSVLLWDYSNGPPPPPPPHHHHHQFYFCFSFVFLIYLRIKGVQHAVPMQQLMCLYIFGETRISVLQPKA